MKVFHNIKARNIAYDKILRCIYKCSTINEKFSYIVAGISEDEFVKECFKPNKIPSREFIGRIDKGFKNVDDLYYRSKTSTVKMWLMIRTDNLLKNTYKKNMLSLFSDIFLMVEELDNDKNFLINLFMNLKLFFDYRDIFYIFSLLQIFECELNPNAIKENNANKYFYNSLKSILKIITVEQLLSIIGEDRIKRYFLLLFDNVMIDIEVGKYIRNHSEFFFLLKTFDTYKWLDLKRKGKLNMLAKEKHIFYKKHAEYLKKLGKNEYMGEMMFVMMEYDDCMIF